MNVMADRWWYIRSFFLGVCGCTAAQCCGGACWKCRLTPSLRLSRSRAGHVAIFPESLAFELGVILVVLCAASVCNHRPLVLVLSSLGNTLVPCIKCPLVTLRSCAFACVSPPVLPSSSSSLLFMSSKSESGSVSGKNCGMCIVVLAF